MNKLDTVLATQIAENTIIDIFTATKVVDFMREEGYVDYRVVQESVADEGVGG